MFDRLLQLKTLMLRHGRSSAGSYLADPTSPIPSHCASIVVTSTVRVNASTWLHGVGNKLRSQGSGAKFPPLDLYNYPTKLLILCCFYSCRSNVYLVE